MRLRKEEKRTAAKSVTLTKKLLTRVWDDLIQAMGNLAVNMANAGAKVAWLLDNDETAISGFKALGISVYTWKRLERVGRGHLLAELAVKTSLYDHLSLEEQRWVLERPVVVVDRETGTETSMMLLQADSITQALAVGERKLRTPDEQREYLKSLTVTKAPGKWRIGKTGKVVFQANSSYSLEELLEIVKELEIWKQRHG